MASRTRRRKLPGPPVHELFGERVRAHPDAVAPCHDDKQWTYRFSTLVPISSREPCGAGCARRRHLCSMERNLDWMACARNLSRRRPRLTCRPHFPADRIAKRSPRRPAARADRTRQHMRRSTRARIALRVQTPLHRCGIAETMQTATRHRVTRNQLAYITSPPVQPASQGAMCEHTGCFTHLCPRFMIWNRCGGWSPRRAPVLDISLWNFFPR